MVKITGQKTNVRVVMNRKNKLIMRVVLSELMTSYPKPLHKSQLGTCGANNDDVDMAIECLTNEHFIACSETGELSLTSDFTNEHL